jgi:hypothetical protein
MLVGFAIAGWSWLSGRNHRVKRGAIPASDGRRE